MRARGDMGDKAHQVRLGRAHHRRVEPVKKRARAGIEGAELIGGARSGKLGDGLRVAAAVVKEVKPAAIGPEMPRQQRLADKADMILQPLAAIGKESVEHAAQREHGRPRRDGTGGRGQGAHLAAHMVVTFQQRDGVARMGEPRGGREPRDPRPDDHGLIRCPGCHGRIVDSGRRYVQYDLHIGCHYNVT